MKIHVIGCVIKFQHLVLLGSMTITLHETFTQGKCNNRPEVGTGGIYGPNLARKFPKQWLDTET